MAAVFYLHEWGQIQYQIRGRKNKKNEKIYKRYERYAEYN